MLMCCYSDRTVSAISYTDFIFPPLCASPTSVLFDILLSFSFFFFKFLFCCCVNIKRQEYEYRFWKANRHVENKILDCLSNILLLVLVTKQIMHGI